MVRSDLLFHVIFLLHTVCLESCHSCMLNVYVLYQLLIDQTLRIFINGVNKRCMFKEIYSMTVCCIQDNHKKKNQFYKALINLGNGETGSQTGPDVSSSCSVISFPLACLAHWPIPVHWQSTVRDREGITELKLRITRIFFNKGSNVRRV